MLRNYRFLHEQTQSFVNAEGKTIEYNAESLTAKKYGDYDNSNDKAPEWLFKRRQKKYGTLAGEITYYKTLTEFKNGQIAHRYCDRLFFDFDIDDNKDVEQIKTEFKEANETLTGNAYRRKCNHLQRQFQKLIFNDNILFDVFNEAKALLSYLETYQLKPVFIFSGSKGFHINVIFEETQLQNLSTISKTLADTYKKELGLKYLDYNVFDKTRAHKRLQRIPYGLHGKTGLITRPLPSDINYDELLAEIKKTSRKPVQFNYNEHKAPRTFNKLLKQLDTNIAYKKQQRKKKIQAENTRKKKELKKQYGDKYRNYSDIDMRDIAAHYGIDGKSQDNKIICLCPFHNDKHPSAVIYPSRFYCSTCNVSMNYYEFISNLEGTNDKIEIMQKASEFL